jgi:hypothetical protein
MDPLILLQRARDAGLRLEVADTSLKISGPRKAEPLVRLLAEHKARVLDALREVQEVQKVQGTESRGTSTEHDPGRYASALAAFRAKCPAYVDAADWQQAIEDGHRFVTQWGKQAEALGWAPADLFGLHTPPEKPTPNYRRLSRYDQTGLIWLLQGRRVVELTKDKAIIETATGIVSYRRYNKPALGPLGDSLDDFASGSEAVAPSMPTCWRNE